jgi:hypothetical protein
MITTLLAIWGAALSTITVIWTVWKDRHDCPKLKLTPLLELMAHDSYGQLHPLKDLTGEEHHNAQCVLGLTVTNVGRRPILITGWGTTAANNSVSAFSLASRKPEPLGEGEFQRLGVTAALKDSVRTIFVRDSTGKDWNLPQKQLELLREEAQRLMGSSEQSRATPFCPRVIRNSWVNRWRDW